MSANLLQAQKISKSYGAKTLFEEASFSINEREHVGVIGANGAGKSTLFKILIGRIEADAGEFTQRNGMKIGYLGQEEHQAPDDRVEDYVQSQITEPIWEVKRLGYGLGVQEEHFQMNYNNLSGGYRMRVQLLCLLGQAPDLLLLDEPTNYLDLESLVVLENFLIDYKGAFLLISHDREFLKSTTDHTLEIESGEVTKFAGNIEDYFEQKAQLREILEKTARSITDRRSEILKFAARFGAKASKARQAQSKLKQLKKLEPIKINPLPVAAKINIPHPVRIGKQAISLSDTSFGYGEKEVLKEFSFSLQKGDHAAVVGVNGAGKSTLLKGLAGELKPFTGHIDFGHRVELGYYAQHVAEKLDPRSTVLEELLSAAEGVLPQEAKDLAGSFLFSGDDIHKKISVLSGGEKARVALAQILLKKSPVLLLDEPTNHLDFHTVEALTEALKEYPGTLIIVSHDRSFISRVSSKIIEIRDGTVDLFPGSYDEYVWSLKKGSWSTKAATKEKHDKNKQKPAAEKAEPEKKVPRKERQKAIARDIRRFERKIKEAEAAMEEKKSSIERKNQKLQTLRGLEANQLAREIGFDQSDVLKLEEEWLELSDQLEQLKAKEL